ncbi:MAG: hypothetical protein VX265_10305, partial [Myxococcota bacterium]|nr:hypothetical protein [Myxococcota bacterium]
AACRRPRESTVTPTDPTRQSLAPCLPAAVAVAVMLWASATAALAADGPPADVWLSDISSESQAASSHGIPPLQTASGPIPAACLGMMLGILPSQADQMIGSVYLQDNQGRGCLRANDPEGIVRFDHVEYEVVAVEENNTFRLRIHALEWTGVAVEDFVIPSYKLAVRFERQPYVLDDNTVVQALVAVNLGAW